MTGLSAGFADPGACAQTCFRAVLDAMAHPGSLHRIARHCTPPASLDPATAAIILTLIDAGTGVWIDPALAAAEPWITFHTGAARAAMASAAFLLTTTLPDLGMVATGTDEAPEEAATIILQVAALGSGAALSLAGPGIRVTETLRVRGLPPAFAELWARNHALFPRGADLLLCAGDRLAALPRSVTVAAA